MRCYKRSTVGSIGTARQAGWGYTMLTVGLWVSACGGAGPSSEASASPDLARTRGGTFTHTLHLSKDKVGKALGCNSCHEVDLEAGYRVIRPGHNDHSPCDDCHADDFKKAPGTLCENCHIEVNPLQEGASPLYSYPSRERKTAALVSSYNHAQHVAAATREEGGSGLNCMDCHRLPKDAAMAGFPAHGDCAPCHAAVAAPRMSDCNGCHERDGPGRNRKFLCNDIRFTHAKHRRDVSGHEIACTACHADVLHSTDSDQLTLPRMSDCATCHDRADRTPARVRIDNCGLCHQDDMEANRHAPANHSGESREERAKARCP